MLFMSNAKETTCRIKVTTAQWHLSIMEDRLLCALCYFVWWMLVEKAFTQPGERETLVAFRQAFDECQRRYTTEDCIGRYLVARYKEERGQSYTLPKSKANENKPFKLYIDVVLNEISSVDIEGNSIYLKLNMDLFWVDPYLNWFEVAGNYTQNFIRLPASTIWTPDLGTFEEGIVRDTRGSSAKWLLVFRSGLVLLSPIITYESSCEFNPRNFPFDQHTCTVEFASARPSESQLLLPKESLCRAPMAVGAHKAGKPQQMQENVNCSESYLDKLLFGEGDFASKLMKQTNSHWELIDWRFSNRVNALGTRWNRSSLVYTIDIKRRDNVYAITLIFPAFTLSIMSLPIFWLPIVDSTRIDYGLNIVVSYFVLMTIVVEHLPKSQNTVPLLSLYYLLSISLIGVSVVLSAVFNKMHQWKVRRVRMPRCLKQLLYCGRKPTNTFGDQILKAEDIEKTEKKSANNIENIDPASENSLLASKVPRYLSRSDDEIHWDNLLLYSNRITMVLYTFGHVVGMVLIYYL